MHGPAHLPVNQWETLVQLQHVPYGGNMQTRLSGAQEAVLSAELGTRLREFRAREDRTQAEVAALVGMSSEVYGRFERGTCMPSVPMVLALAAALRVEPGELFGQAPASLSRPAPWSLMTELAAHVPESPAAKRVLMLLKEALPGDVEFVAQLLSRLQR